MTTALNQFYVERTWIMTSQNYFRELQKKIKIWEYNKLYSEK